MSKRDKLPFLDVRPRDQGGAFAVIEKRDLKDILDGAEISEWEIKEVWMTRDEFEALPERGGW